ncbi:hypothetical protein BDZ85DRAFT_258047 [Elsinoe ampelina]|uniref:Uncharacterized protein n=1 Tax=Elsinoe ampelina TaxID=302913 RepID=A0A6A6GJ40_9PEZI|nr:hypothetical protein BDZ85DRAFT_258047 [Elsinoe ampelina]
MPHKHTRRPGASSAKDFDLPPTTTARPLAVGKKSKGNASEQKGKKRKRGNDDDTPREFKRLMELQKHMAMRKGANGSASTRPGGVEDMPRQKKATGKGKPRAKEASVKLEDAEEVENKKDLKKPAEPKRSNGLDDPAWGQRGPMSKDIPALKEKSSRLQRKIEKKVATWRTEDERLRKKREEDVAKYREQEEERISALLEKSGMSSAAIEDPDLLKQLGLDDGADDLAEKEVLARRGKKKRKGKEEDDFAVLKEKRERPKGLHDVVQAPPELKKLKDRFGTKKAVVSGEGGLKRQADLQEARMEVIKRYREMMGRKKDM